MRHQGLSISDKIFVKESISPISFEITLYKNSCFFIPGGALLKARLKRATEKSMAFFCLMLNLKAGCECVLIESLWLPVKRILQLNSDPRIIYAHLMSVG